MFQAESEIAGLEAGALAAAQNADGSTPSGTTLVDCREQALRGFPGGPSSRSWISSRSRANRARARGGSDAQRQSRLRRRPAAAPGHAAAPRRAEAARARRGRRENPAEAPSAASCAESSASRTSTTGQRALQDQGQAGHGERFGPPLFSMWRRRRPTAVRTTGHANERARRRKMPGQCAAERALSQELRRLCTLSSPGCGGTAPARRAAAP